jgi:nucleotide-binding universal stress UspA family protein
MKTILVPTDFSAAAKKAALWALYLARTLKVNLTLCHALQVHGVLPIEDLAVNPLDEYVLLHGASEEQLKSQVLDLRDHLPEVNLDSVRIDTLVSAGPVGEVVCNAVSERKASLVVMGMVGSGMMKRLLLGSNSQQMINLGAFPILLVPAAGFHAIVHKIAFATDLSKGDIEIIHSLAGFAASFHAEILLVHISGGKIKQTQLDEFLTEVSSKVNYPKIYCRIVEEKNIDKGLNWIARNGLISIFAMVHRRKSFPANLLSGSHTHELSRNIEIPLLVFPEHQSVVF